MIESLRAASVFTLGLAWALVIVAMQLEGLIR